MRMKWLGSVAVLGAIAACATLAQAQETYWQHDPATTGDWSVPANWTNGVPVSGDTAYIDNGGTVGITTDISGWPTVIVGQSATGSIAHTAGYADISSVMTLGQTEGSYGLYDISGSAFLEINEIHILRGDFNQTGGTVYPGNLILWGYDSATYTSTGGFLSVRDELRVVSQTAETTAEFTQDGAFSRVSTKELKIGGDIRYGRYVLNNGLLNVTSVAYVSGLGASLEINGGESHIGALYLGRRPAYSGSFTLTGGDCTMDSVDVDHGSTYSVFGADCDVSTRFFVSATSSCSVNGTQLSLGYDTDVQGTIEFGPAGSSLVLSGISDLADATIVNPGACSLEASANSITVLPAGFNKSDFSSIIGSGVVVNAGQTATIAAGTNIVANGRIKAHVDCQGSIRVPPGGSGSYTEWGDVDIIGGVRVSGNGDVDLGMVGTLTIENEISGISSGRLDVFEMHVGKTGTGKFVQTGGTVEYDGPLTVGGTVTVGRDAGSTGVYEMSGGVLRVNEVFVGEEGVGSFVQTGGNIYLTFSTRASISVGGWSGGSGQYELRDGEIRGAYIYVNGRFTQTGGKYTAVGPNSDSGVHVSPGGVCRLVDGQVDCRKIKITMHTHDENPGSFLQSAGTATIGVLEIGGNSSAGGTYAISDGQFEMGSAYIGGGTLRQTGGVVNVTTSLQLTGSGYGGYGLVDLSGGSFTAKTVEIALNSGRHGELSITNSSADVTVSDKLQIRSGGRFSAVPGATIHMTGSAFENESTSSENLSGLKNLRLIFEGGSEDEDPVEVAGQNKGAVMEGLEGNFALGTLQLGGADIGWVQLVDTFDNQPGWSGSEALYVEDLILGAGSTLDLNGLNLYYLSFSDDGGTILNGTPTEIPEPAFASLFAMGLSVLLARRRRRRK